MATITVERDMSAAPTAGLSRRPEAKRTPAAGSDVAIESADIVAGSPSRQPTVSSGW